jgi:hypothetical protein
MRREQGFPSDGNYHKKWPSNVPEMKNGIFFKVVFLLNKPTIILRNGQEMAVVVVVVVEVFITTSCGVGG